VQWLPHIPPPLDSVTNTFLRGLRRQIDFEPASTWENVHCPVLVLLGELDANVPSKVSATIIESGLKKAMNKDYTIKVLPKANHGLFQCETGYSTESPRLKQYVRGYMDGIADWVPKRLAARK
jgi:dienelactone hydrolase